MTTRLMFRTEIRSSSSTTSSSGPAILVERVKFLRSGEERGGYDQVVATVNDRDPHGM